ncbi:MAG: SRPBCC domain-containing protein [Patescibacteria group bacterium]
MEQEYKTITIERTINAPRERVFKAWIDSEQLKQWHYATEGWSTPYAKVDAHVGGKFDIGFKSPDGKNDFAFEGTFTEMKEPERIAYTIADGRPVTVDFIEEGDKTKVILVLALETENSEELQRGGWTEMVVHLEQLMAK